MIAAFCARNFTRMMQTLSENVALGQILAPAGCCIRPPLAGTIPRLNGAGLPQRGMPTSTDIRVYSCLLMVLNRIDTAKHGCFIEEIAPASRQILLLSKCTGDCRD